MCCILDSFWVNDRLNFHCLGPINEKILSANAAGVENILDSNIFKFKVEALPPSVQKATYLKNGSAQLNVSMIVGSFLVFLWTLVVVRVTTTWWLSGLPIPQSIKDTIALLAKWANAHLFTDCGGGIARTKAVLRDMVTAMRAATVAAAMLSLVYILLKAAPSEGASYATYENQYGWVLSAAYLQGVVPITLITVAVLVMTVIYAHLHCYKLPPPSLHKQQQQQQRRMVMQSRVKFMAWLLFKASALLVNAVVMLALNFAYIFAVVENNKYLILIQVSVGLFKSVWCAFIPQATRAVADNLSAKGVFDATLSNNPLSEHMYLLSILIFNVIVAPGIAAALSSNRCYLEVFVQQAASPISTQLPCVGQYYFTFVDQVPQAHCGSPTGPSTSQSTCQERFSPPSYTATSARRQCS